MRSNRSLNNWPRVAFSQQRRCGVVVCSGLAITLAGGMGCELGEPIETAPAFEPDLMLVSEQPGDEPSSESMDPKQAEAQQEERAAVLSGTNLVYNSSFETGISGWSAPFGGTLTLATDQAYRGSQSGVVSNRSEPYQGAHFTVTEFIEQGAVYDVRVFVRIAGASTDNVVLTGLTQCQGEDSQFATIASGIGENSRWTELHGQFQVSSTDACEVALARVYVEGPAADVDLYVDDLEFIKL